MKSEASEVKKIKLYIVYIVVSKLCHLFSFFLTLQVFDLPLIYFIYYAVRAFFYISCDVGDTRYSFCGSLTALWSSPSVVVKYSSDPQSTAIIRWDVHYPVSNQHPWFLTELVWLLITLVLSFLLSLNDHIYLLIAYLLEPLFLSVALIKFPLGCTPSWTHIIPRKFGSTWNYYRISKNSFLYLICDIFCNSTSVVWRTNETRKYSSSPVLFFFFWDISRNNRCKLLRNTILVTLYSYWITLYSISYNTIYSYYTKMSNETQLLSTSGKTLWTYDIQGWLKYIFIINK